MTIRSRLLVTAAALGVSAALYASAYAQEVGWTMAPSTVTGEQDLTLTFSYDTGGRNQYCCSQGGLASESCQVSLDDGQTSSAFNTTGTTVPTSNTFHVQPNHGPNGDYTRQYTVTLVDHCFVILNHPNAKTGRNYIEVDSGHDEVSFILVVYPQ